MDVVVDISGFVFGDDDDGECGLIGCGYVKVILENRSGVKLLLVLMNMCGEYGYYYVVKYDCLCDD